MSDRSDSEIYARLLLRRQHGYPLWKPKPYESLPEFYRMTGTRLGDVGRITQDGHFHFLFNALAPADDLINSQGGVPANFQPLEFDLKKVLKCVNYHEPGVPIFSIGTKRYELAVDATAQITGTPAEGSSGVELKFEDKEGALLLLPEGATRIDVETILPFRQYAHQNCEEWYRFAEARGIEVENGSLYFVTGFDKTTCWENAAFSNPTRAASVSLKLTSGIGPGGRLQLSQSSNIVTPIARGRSPSQCEMNQSVFIRGFKITLRTTAKYMFQSPVKVMDLSSGALKGLKPKDIIARGGPVTFNERRLGSPRSYSPPSPSTPSPSEGSGRSRSLWLQWSSPSSTSSHRNVSRQCEGFTPYLDSDSELDSDIEGNSFEDYDSESDSDDEESMAESITSPYHPANVLNDLLLAHFPESHVAITHDNDWCELLDEYDAEMPTNEDLVTRATSKYDMINENGCVFFQKPSTMRSSMTEKEDVKGETLDRLVSFGLSSLTTNFHVEHSPQRCLEVTASGNHRITSLSTGSIFETRNIDDSVQIVTDFDIISYPDPSLNPPVPEQRLSSSNIDQSTGPTDAIFSLRWLDVDISGLDHSYTQHCGTTPSVNVPLSPLPPSRHHPHVYAAESLALIPNYSDALFFDESDHGSLERSPYLPDPLRLPNNTYSLPLRPNNTYSLPAEPLHALPQLAPILKARRPARRHSCERELCSDHGSPSSHYSSRSQALDHSLASSTRVNVAANTLIEASHRRRKNFDLIIPQKGTSFIQKAPYESNVHCRLGEFSLPNIYAVPSHVCSSDPWFSVENRVSYGRCPQSLHYPILTSSDMKIDLVVLNHPQSRRLSSSPVIYDHLTAPLVAVQDLDYADIPAEPN
ncbi:SCF ubiquitin ligase complex subunit cdc4 [Stygiomarasmius scandens]|uniref:SCF ubiquitin ligase complex subunit cdc4 n=1 Tax=Marasmiellus scandens TaxID=2682957 RepID=A0ABR1J1D7_9AGAR